MAMQGLCMFKEDFHCLFVCLFVCLLVAVDFQATFSSNDMQKPFLLQ